MYQEKKPQFLGRVSFCVAGLFEGYRIAPGIWEGKKVTSRLVGAHKHLLPVVSPSFSNKNTSFVGFFLCTDPKSKNQWSHIKV